MRRYDPELQTERLSVWGYRGECPCGWRGDRQQAMSAARQDLYEHINSLSCNPTKGGNG